MGGCRIAGRPACIALVVLVSVFICLSPPPCQARTPSGIPDIDTLPLNDWHVDVPPLSYSKALLYSLAFPGGGQIYTRHPVRAGFLMAFEVGLLGDGLFLKRDFAAARRREIHFHLDSADILTDRLLSPGRQAPSAEEIQTLESERYDQISLVRQKADLMMKQRDLANSEIAWGLGMHAYGILDAMEMVHQSRNPGRPVRSAKAALYRGLIFPGWGQLYNDRYGKFGLLWMAMGSSMVSAASRHQVVQYFQGRIEVAGREGDPDLPRLEKDLTLYRKRRNQYYWGMALLYVYGVMDGMVDASFSGFDTPANFALMPGESPFSLSLAYRFR